MRLDTIYPADSVEFCPVQGYHDILACGTYKLIEGPTTSLEQESESGESTTTSHRKRIGKCILLKAHSSQEDERLEILQEIDMPAILDMKWSHSSSLLAVADSEGHVSLHKLDTNVRGYETGKYGFEVPTQQARLTEIQNVQCRPKDTLCLSLDWSNRRNARGDGCIAVSCSDGSLSVFQPDTSGCFAEMRSWHAHDFEAWITAWDYWNTNIVYSGGDDLKLRGWDIRQDDHSPIFVNKKFDAGVTSIQCHPHNESILAVGSYDATVRIFDTRKPLAPITQADVGGGAWRIKWHPSPARGRDLLVACMHDGFKVVRFSPSIISSNNAQSEASEEWETLKRFDAHESLSYGIDWAYGGVPAEGTLIASCSFYDHVLYTWKG
ncbi:hypothetical protein ACEPAH_618 [Sanghuangporus vaninii]